MHTRTDVASRSPRGRGILYLAAIYNVLAAALVVALARIAPAALGVEPFTASQLLYVDLVALLVAGFGAGYALGGWNLARYWPCVAIGGGLKVGVAVLVTAYFLAGQSSLLVQLLGAGDAVFAFVFAALLRAHFRLPQEHRESGT